MKISVLGCGRWATFLAWYLNKKHDVTLWGRENSKRLISLQQTRKNEYLTLPNDIELTSDLTKALENDTIVVSILAQEFRNFVQTIKNYDLSGKDFVLCMKGIESTTGERLSEILEENGINKNHIAIWVGPGHVEYFLSGIPNCMLIDSYNKKLAYKLIDEFSTNLIRFYVGQDVLGAEIGASAKNVLGICAGILDGKNMSCLKGALMARGTREYSRLIEALGGDKMTPYGLSHLGDYEATLFSPYSHNRAWGEAFAKGEHYEHSAEGVGNILGFKKLAEKAGVELPITDALYNIIFEHHDIQEELEKLFSRQITKEFVDEK